MCNRVASIELVYEGFCANCQQPTQVGNLAIKTLENRVPLCAPCLDRMARKVDMKDTLANVEQERLAGHDIECMCIACQAATHPSDCRCTNCLYADDSPVGV